MLQLTVAGNVGRDAAYKETQSGKGFCSFTVAANIGFGDSKQTVWVDVTRWGEGAKGLANILRKGSRVAVTGEMSLREHDGKTYVQCRADKVTILGTPEGHRETDDSQERNRYGVPYGGKREYEDAPRQSAPQGNDLDDEIPW